MIDEMIYNFTSAVGVEFIQFIFAFFMVGFLVFPFIHNFTHRYTHR